MTNLTFTTRKKRIIFLKKVDSFGSDYLCTHTSFQMQRHGLQMDKKQAKGQWPSSPLYLKHNLHTIERCLQINLEQKEQLRQNITILSDRQAAIKALTATQLNLKW